MNSTKKVIIFILVIVALIVLGVIIGIRFKNNLEKRVENTRSVEVSGNLNNYVANNEINLNGVINTTNEISGNEVTEEPEEEEAPKTPLEKAISIVKKDWGLDNSVYFAEDGTTVNGEYIIAVRRKSTTEALAWYTVNVATGTFTKE